MKSNPIIMWTVLFIVMLLVAGCLVDEDIRLDVICLIILFGSLLTPVYIIHVDEKKTRNAMKKAKEKERRNAENEINVEKKIYKK